MSSDSVAPRDESRASVWRRSECINILTWTVAYGAIVIALPLMSLETGTTVNSAFGDMGFYGVMFSALMIWGCCLTIVFDAGLQVQGALQRQVDVWSWMQACFTIPLGLGAKLVAAALAIAPTVALVSLASPGGGTAVAAAIVGAALAFGLIWLWKVPYRALERNLKDNPGRRGFWLRVSIATSWPVRVLSGIGAFGEPFKRQLELNGLGWRPPHFLALCCAAGVALVIAGFGILLDPPYSDTRVLQAPFLVYALLGIAVWVLGAVRFLVAGTWIPAWAPLAVLVGFEYAISNDSLTQTFEVRQLDTRDVTLGTAEILASAEASPNERASPNDIVVVCASGGGILSAAWTATALEDLTGRAFQPGELRVVSGVSGGSVGIAFYLYSLLNRHAATEGAAVSGTPAADAAAASSLQAVMYGLVYEDAFRPIRTLFGSYDGRGQELEDQWLATASRLLGGDGRLALSDLRPGVLRGEIPAPIFNATVMETGRRVMITPIEFPPTRGAESVGEQADGVTWFRSYTLDEHIRRAGSKSDSKDKLLRDGHVLLEDGKSADLSVWAAARMSATFPYMTPAAAPAIRAEGGPPKVIGNGQHLIDGGYYDNYGVASALDWLRVVMDQKNANGELDEELLKKRRIVVIELRAFKSSPTEDEPPQASLPAALLGPVTGVSKIRDGTAQSRNLIEMQTFVERWNGAFEQSPDIVRWFRIEPPSGDAGPLSWRLTHADREKVRADWKRATVVDKASGAPLLPQGGGSAIEALVTEIREHLDGN